MAVRLLVNTGTVRSLSQEPYTQFDLLLPDSRVLQLWSPAPLTPQEGERAQVEWNPDETECQGRSRCTRIIYDFKDERNDPPPGDLPPAPGQLPSPSDPPWA